MTAVICAPSDLPHHTGSEEKAMGIVHVMKKAEGSASLVPAGMGRAGGLPAPRAARPRGGFHESPLLVIWEVTRACALSCAHCRADAIARRDPHELTTAEGRALLDQVAGFGTPAPLVVLTGGDPMWRKDLAELVAHGTHLGLKVALTPSGTAAATRARLSELRDAGLRRLAVSLDAAAADTHDGFRGVRGSFNWTRRIIDDALDLGLSLQINTTVSAWTLPGLGDMAAFVQNLPLELWAVFFLVQTGRGASLAQISASECETALTFLTELSARVPFAIKTTEAPHYRRVLREAGLRSRFPGVNDGNGFMFVDHVGNICPSGFLPLASGNMRDVGLAETYRDDPVFRLLRDPDALRGRCGRCQYRVVCGGSRSRAFSATGDFLGEDPLCDYQPGPGVEPLVAR
jgi:MoaA/NifB/PqqE/SkfB family radical SAM enzyme